MGELSKTQIDKLGERLRKGEDTIDDLILLDQYRDSFQEAFERVTGYLRSDLALEPSGRVRKTTKSIRDKLRRQAAGQPPIELSRIQDIAGCRLVVYDLLEQENVLAKLRASWSEAKFVDRRDRPSNGYRAVHLIVKALGRKVEIQLRTSLEHLWAEASEKLAMRIDPAIKYGGGPEFVRSILDRLSETIQLWETLSRSIQNTIALEESSSANPVGRVTYISKDGDKALLENYRRNIQQNLLALIDEENTEKLRNAKLKRDV